jgi:hypothetical protein
LAAWHDNDSEAPSLASSHTVTAAEGHSIPKGSRPPARPQVTETQFLEDIIPLDEFFFDMHTDYEQMSLPTDVIEILPKGQNFNTNYTVHLCLQNSRK